MGSGRASDDGYDFSVHTLTVIIAIVVIGRSVAMVMLVEFSLILV